MAAHCRPALYSFDKNNVMKKLLLTLAALYAFGLPLIAQKHVPDTALKNTVRINVTPLLITSRAGSFALGYERVLKSHQSVSANIGHLQMPALITTKEGDPVKWINNLRNTGFVASADYRFYFKRNRYTAPDGLYWGPYAAYYYFDNKARVELVKNNLVEASADLQTYFSMATVGLQLGYQFVVGKRWTIDMILIGPGMGFYKLDLKIDADGQITGDEEYYQGVYDALVSIFPAIEQLFKEQDITARGAKSFNGLGYRMVLQVGYRF